MTRGTRRWLRQMTRLLTVLTVATAASGIVAGLVDMGPIVSVYIGLAFALPALIIGASWARLI
jgi:hypothetical protein